MANFCFLPAHYQREGSRCWQCGNQRTQGQQHGPKPDGVPPSRWSPQGNHPQDRPGRTPRPLRPPATKKVDFSSYTSGQHLRPGLVTLDRAHPERVPQARTLYWVVNPAVESLPRRVTISPQEPVFLGREPSGTGAGFMII